MSSTKNVSTPFLLKRNASKKTHHQKATFQILIRQYSAAITHTLSTRKPSNRERPHYINPVTSNNNNNNNVHLSCTLQRPEHSRDTY